MEDNIEVNVIRLEDNVDYMIVSAITENNNKYFLLAKEDSPKEILLRKVIVEDGKEYLVKLDNDDEFDEVMTLFSDKLNKREGINEE